jgi:hypothetical protein
VKNEQYNNSLMKGSNGEKIEGKKVLPKDKYEIKSKLSYQSSLPKASKWGQFVEVNLLSILEFPPFSIENSLPSTKLLK